MGKCIVKKCMSRSGTNNKASGVTFHKVPISHELRKKWIENIRLLRKETDWLPSTHTVICSKHFQDRDMILPTQEEGLVRLSNEAVPMVFNENESPVKIESPEEIESPVEIDDDNLNVDTDEEMLEILETQREHKMKITIERLKILSLKRLKCLKSLRERNRRLKKRNKKLSDVIKEVKNKRYLIINEELMAKQNRN